MSFDRAEYQRTVAAVTTGVDDLRSRIADMPAAANAALGSVFLPAPARDALVWCVEQLVEVASDVLDVIVDALQGVAAPVLFFDTAHRWADVRGSATGVVATLNPALLPATGVWSGDAADAYTRAVKPQTDAAARIGTLADKMTTALLTGATAGLTFYIAVGLILAKLIAALVAAIAAFGTAVLSPVGVALVLEEAAVTPALLTGAVTTLIAALGVQAGQLVLLHGEAADLTAFPDGRWPTATADRYADATVTDGDADWSLTG